MKKAQQKYPLACLLEKGIGTAVYYKEGSLSYDELRILVSKIGEQLAGINIGPGDPVGIVIPNGPQAATIFISVASYATAAPLNPAYTKSEFKFYLKDLKTKVLLVSENSNSSAIIAAKELNIRVISIRSRELPGDITLVEDRKILT